MQRIQFIANSPTFNNISYFSELITDSFHCFEFMQFSWQNSWQKTFLGKVVFRIFATPIFMMSPTPPHPPKLKFWKIFPAPFYQIGQIGLKSAVTGRKMRIFKNERLEKALVSPHNPTYTLRFHRIYENHFWGLNPRCSLGVHESVPRSQSYRATWV